MRHSFALIALATLAACGKSDNAPGPGGVTVGEARALDEAAEMIDQRQLPKEALRPPAAVPSTAPTANAAP
ncbi:MAG: hypothetical protein JF595_02785 [Sphingomonadales bacterium]|nr:hypothetical protein [Sphingomonadales bacterium]